MLQDKINMLDALPVGDGESHAIIDSALTAVREHLDMPIAYLSEFVGDQTIFRNVSAPGLEDLIKPGDSRHLDEVYCQHILRGDLPELIPDTAAFPLAQSLPITNTAPIGSHVSLPIHRADGSVYGMFCCLSPVANPSLNDRDIKVMRLFADLAAEQVRLNHSRQSELEGTRNIIRDMLRDAAFDMVFQPIYRLADGGLASFESLCRFRSDPYRSPDKWFDDARTAGLQTELELKVIDAALKALPGLPPHARLAVNAAPDTVASGALLPILSRVDPTRLTLEITEHERSNDFDRLLRAVQAIGARGTWIAIDDVGAGYSGLQQILQLRPDILKLDMSLVRDIDTDTARRSLAGALVSFASETDAKVTAEGIERRAEWDCLRMIGADYGQGWLMGRPGPMNQAAPNVTV
ncbi:sensor domain-containing phosphodiesterase [Jannaschia helgolandensis]|uniref:sensor domain-containing phosphodiesterase n=1 Tax=Jannaschia helgolandensis TaxID=188906 RepID=UPI0030DAB2A0